MKKRILSLLIVIALLLCTACTNEGEVNKNKPKSTDLSMINVDGIALGNSIRNLDLTKYTSISEEQTTHKKNTKYFEEIQLTTTDEGIVTEIKGIVSEKILLNVNEIQSISINDVISELGKNYNEYWFDKEQNLKAFTYYDETNNMYATFTTYDKKIVWLILNR